MPTTVMINIFGPPTAGKSTIVELLRKQIERVYTVDFDVVKHQISGYDWKRDSQIAQSITFDTLVSVAKTGLPIIVLLPLPREQVAFERVATTASENDYRLFNIEISAPEEVLLRRYEDRLRNTSDSALKQKMKNIEEQKIYIRTPFYRPDNTSTFDSSEKAPQEIFEAIEELIRQV